MKIGFIGLGKMGGGLARNLILKGNNVYLYDINEQASKEIQKDGGTIMNSPEALAEKVDVLFTSLPLPQHLINLLIEENLLKFMKEDSILIDVSTIDPKTATKIKNEAENYNIQFLACPLGKGPKQAYEGTLPIFIGGNKKGFQKTEFIFDQIGEPHYLGGVEQSTAFKLISNMVGMTNLLAMSEGIKLAKATNIDLDQFKQLLHDTGADSAQLHLRAPLILEDQYDPMFSVDLALKDVRLGVEMAKSYSEKTDLSNTALTFLNKASEEGYGEEDCAAVFKAYKD